MRPADLGRQIAYLEYMLRKSIMKTYVYKYVVKAANPSAKAGDLRLFYTSFVSTLDHWQFWEISGFFSIFTLRIF